MAFVEIKKEQNEVSFPEKFKFEKAGDVIEGVYLGTRETDFGGKGELTTFIQIDTGEQGTKEIKQLAALANLFEKVKINDIVRVTYLGEEKNPRTNRVFKNFKVEIDQ